ncbi:hypothetical protein LI142_06595 [Eubacterium limosum]|uniref:Uncharacterized protein n=1 Tax=Eubacterium limosum TaxID=1736 RepID=A0ABT5UPJ0_EUBLI|nr:hypothetical protein [Eubacterium limosum]MCB6569169.1 hypothetical protein [Eubacterium limosum]MDE1470868.1 hypothetical protein [Eubacterium limosum]
MNVKISRFVNLKILAVTLAVIIAIMPFFQPKKVQASPLLIGIVALLTTGMIAGGYARDTILTPEQINNANDYCTANLQAAFPDPAEYNKQLGILQNLDNDIKAGKDIDWSKYSGKALYAVLKGVVDVVGPTQEQAVVTDNEYFFSYYYDGYITWKPGRNWIVSKKPSWPYRCAGTNYATGQSFDSLGIGEKKNHHPMTGTVDAQLFFYGSSGKKSLYFYSDTYYFKDEIMPIYRPLDGMDPYCKNVLLGGNGYLVPNITAKTANKVKLPTRLPQTVINNINNYYNGDTENLTIAPTPEELPTLPDGYNPVTNDLPDLPGYVDVTPDQEPTTDPEPTPTPPDPTPTPPEYNGDEWVNPIGDFFDGLLKFMKAAFIPTLSLNLDALSAVPDNLGEKFPFSLPSDIIGMVTMFQAEPVPIEISFNIPTHIFGYQDIPIKGDTSFMDDYMPAIRNLIFLLFLFSLAWSTFNMFFGGGDD